MNLRFEDIVSLDEEPPRQQSRSRPRRAPRVTSSRTSRRTFLRGALAVGAGIGVASLGIFPAARKASATGHRQIWDGRDHGHSTECGGLGSWVTDDNCQGCNNPRIHCCCTSDGWHKNDGKNYKLRSNVCKSGGWDGWLWKQGPCCGNGRKNQRWRCHDGWFCSSGDCADRHCSEADQAAGNCRANQWKRSICKFRLNSDPC